MKNNRYKNILILEAGGPCGVVCLKVLRKIKGIKLFGADMDIYSSGLQMTDVSIKVPPSSADNFGKAVEDIIIKYKIDAIFPCFEYGYDKLKNVKGNFLIDFESAVRNKDKYGFNLICEKASLPVPKTHLYNLNKVPDDYPVYIKPRSGVGSKDNYVIKNKEQYLALSKFISGNTEFIVQEFLTGEHWSIDVLVDKGVFITAVSRRDIMQKGGNPITVEVKRYPKLIRFATKVQKVLNIQSPFNLEVFEVSKGEFVINEINTRFGSGIIFTVMSGVDMVSYLATGNDKYLGKSRDGIFSRYLEEIKVLNKSY